MESGKISFILFSYNEERRIEYAVRNFRPYGEVYVFDGGSTDRTREVAETNGARFILRPASSKPQVETQEMFLFVKSQVSTGYIFWSYVDNLCPARLLDKLGEIASEGKFKYVSIPLHTYLWGDTARVAQYGRTPCFFHKDFIDFSGNRIHGMGKFTGSKTQILELPDRPDYAIKHFSVYDMHKFVLSHLRYAETEAEEAFKAGRRFSWIQTLGGMARYFFIFSRGWRSNGENFFSGFLYAFFRFMARLRLYELEHNITTEGIESEYRKAKLQLLDEIESGGERL